MTKTIGHVLWFNDSKGIGVISVNGESVLAHYSAITGEGFKTLSDGHRVEFDLHEGQKGAQASNIVKLGDDPEGFAKEWAIRENKKREVRS